MNLNKDVLSGLAGFTLLEVLIAMAIFAIGVLSISSMQISATNSNTVARKATEASELAQGQIELLMSIPYTSLSSGNTTSADGYGVSWTVAATTNPPGQDVQIRVLDPRGKTRSAMAFRRFPPP